MRLRFNYFVAFLTLFGVEVLIALFIHDSFIRPYVGDVLGVIVIYCFLRIFLTKDYSLLPAMIFLFAAGVEVLQYYDVVHRLHLQENAFLRIVIGSTFDFADIICYAIGCILIYLKGIVTHARRK